MSDQSNRDADVIIVGAGLAGLTAAVYLQQRGKSVKVLEAADRPGGRVKTDKADGYLLDRGFQVLLTEYPEARQLLDYDALKLRSFLPGALIMHDDGISEIMDPFRKPSAMLNNLFSRVGSLHDKSRMLSLKYKLKGKSLEEIFRQPEISTLAAIQEYGFSENMLRHFFRPFMSGIFLENALSTSRRAFDFIFKMVSSGKACIPEQGMEMIPKQVAARLENGAVLCHKKVKSIDGRRIITETGEEFTAPLILVATEAVGFVRNYLPENKTKHYRSAINVYLTADESPIPRPVIALNARGSRLLNNICVMNEVSGAYAPPGKSLISLSVNGWVNASDEELTLQIKDELSRWFGRQTEKWEHLRTYRINYALPNQDSVVHDISPEKIRLKEGLYAAGDYWLNGSINAAIRSGRIAADVIAGEMASA